MKVKQTVLDPNAELLKPDNKINKAAVMYTEHAIAGMFQATPAHNACGQAIYNLITRKSPPPMVSPQTMATHSVLTSIQPKYSGDLWDKIAISGLAKNAHLIAEEPVCLINEETEYSTSFEPNQS